MSKVIKLKQSDIERIVSNIINEQEVGDDTGLLNPALVSWNPALPDNLHTSQPSR